MKELVEALNIFLSVKDVGVPTNCMHDLFMVCGYEVGEFSEEQIKRLEELGFTWDDSHDCFTSSFFGSC